MRGGTTKQSFNVAKPNFAGRKIAALHSSARNDTAPTSRDVIARRNDEAILPGDAKEQLPEGKIATLRSTPLAMTGRDYINELQYFDNVPEVAWNFYIGGYQPAQKWLKDRKGRELSYEDIFHYQKIIVALAETSRIMGEIDKIEI